MTDPIRTSGPVLTPVITPPDNTRVNRSETPNADIPQSNPEAFQTPQTPDDKAGPEAQRALTDTLTQAQPDQDALESLQQEVPELGRFLDQDISGEDAARLGELVDQLKTKLPPEKFAQTMTQLTDKIQSAQGTGQALALELAQAVQSPQDEPSPIPGISRREIRDMKVALVGMRGNPAAARMLQNLEVVLTGEMPPGQPPANAEAAAINRGKGLFLLAVHARQLQAQNPELAKKLGVEKLNGIVDSGLSKISNPHFRNIAERYLGANGTRSAGADSDQRINDLAALAGVMMGAEEWNPNTHGRAVFEMVLDSGYDAAMGLREMLPPSAQQKLDQQIDKLKTRLAGQAPEALGKMLQTLGSEKTREATRYLWRFASEADDAAGLVGKTAHVIDFLKTVGPDMAKKFTGETGEAAFKSVMKFLELDNFSQQHIKALINPNVTPALRVEAAKNLMTTFADKFKVLKAEFPTDKIAAQLEGAFKLPKAALDGVKQAFRLEAVAEKLGLVGEELTKFKEFAGKLGKEALANLTTVMDNAAKLGKNAATALVSTLSGMPPETAEMALKTLKHLSGEALEVASEFLGKAAAVGQDALKAVVSSLAKIPPDMLGETMQVLKHLPMDTLAKAFQTVPKLADEALGAITATGKYFKKMGISMAKYAPKVAAGLAKVLPAVGGIVSAYDTARFGSIALTGKDLSGKEYKDPNVRALALMGAAINGADTALAVTEALGIGNVGIAANIALGVASIAIDVAVEHFNENPMSPEMAKAIQRGAALAAGGGMLMGPTGWGMSAALVNIYGADVLINEWKEMGKEGVAALKKLASEVGELAGQAIDALKDMGKAGKQALVDMVKAGKETAEAAFTALKDLGSQALDEMTALAKTTSKYAQQAFSYIKEQALAGAQKAFDALQSLGDKGLTALKDIATRGGQLASKALDSLQKMGAKGLTALKDLALAGGAIASQALDKLKGMGEKGIQAIKDLALSGKAIAGAAFNELKAMGKAAIGALREVGLKVKDMAGPAIEALKDMGLAAENAIRDIASQVQGVAEDAIRYLKGMGKDAVDSIEAIAKKYGNDIKAVAVKALSQMQGAAKAVEGLVSDMWKSGKQGFATLMDLAGDVGAVASQVKNLVVSKLSAGWDQSKFDVGWDVWNANIDLGPLKKEVGELIDMATSAGGAALTQMKEWIKDHLINTLGIPARVVNTIL
jgi:hypothetical protein